MTRGKIQDSRRILSTMAQLNEVSPCYHSFHAAIHTCAVFLPHPVYSRYYDPHRGVLTTAVDRRGRSSDIALCLTSAYGTQFVS
jgi:hypothetical protein